jgi:DNA-binding response OmpR family regulator
MSDPAPAVVGAERSTPLRIVLVEDNPDYALRVAEMVREAFGEDTTVTAHASLAASRGSFCLIDADCVLLDLFLPDAIGLGGLAQVVEHAPGVPVIVLSGRAGEEMAIQALQHGAQDYLLKGRADAHAVEHAIRYAIESKDRPQIAV